jgi:hypothetical protein
MGHRLVVALSAVALLTACGAAGGTDRSSQTARVSVVQRLGNGAGWTAKGVVDFANDAMTLTVRAPGVDSTEMRYVGLTSYIRDRTGEWVRHDTRGLGAELINLKHRLREPGKALGYLRSVATTIDDVGQEPVRGKATTRHHGTVSLRSDDRTVVVGIDLWVDRHGRVVRLQEVNRTTETTYEFFDFGSNVSVRIPPPEKTRMVM